MKNIIIGTAGHIDHGKTTLIKALTGRNTDRLKEEQERRRNVEAIRQAELPFTNFGKIVSTSSGSINIGAFSKMMYENHRVNIGRNKMFNWLREKGYLIKSGRERNNPKQQYIEQGLFTVSPTIISRTEGDIESFTTLVTGKGQVKIAEMLLKDFQVIS